MFFLEESPSQETTMVVQKMKPPSSLRPPAYTAFEAQTARWRRTGLEELEISPFPQIIQAMDISIWRHGGPRWLCGLFEAAQPQLYLPCSMDYPPTSQRLSLPSNSLPPSCRSLRHPGATSLRGDSGVHL